MTPLRVTKMPVMLRMSMGEPKAMKPNDKIIVSLKWPSTLYVTGDVRPITKKMDRLTKKANTELTMMAKVVSGGGIAVSVLRSSRRGIIGISIIAEMGACQYSSW